MASPQSSRAGLITTIVILAMFGLGVLVWAITENAAKRQAQDEADRAVAKYEEFASKNPTAVNDLLDLKSRKQTLGLDPKATILDVINKLNAQYAAKIDGSANIETAVEVARQKAATAMDSLQKVGALPENSQKDLRVADVIDQLVDVIQKQKAATDNALQQVTDANTQLKTAQDAYKSAQGEAATQVDQARKDADAAKADAASQVAKAQTDLKVAQDSETQTKADTTKALSDAQVKEQRTEQLLAAKQKDVDVLNNKLARMRPQPTDTILRQADGYITRVPGDNIVYINLGYGDHITDGLTFEVYNANDGIPKLSADEDVQPAGKASIEVIKIGQNYSECRVVKQQPGTQLVEGDVIANLVYDKNTTYTFTVYGSFDLNHSGTAKPEDADVLKRLVTTWGGKVSDKISIDTDFLVLGQEPTVPTLSKDDELDAVEKAKFDKANDELTKYTQVRDQAKDLSIPVLNQNRFLYFIGYYDLATR